MTMPGTMVGTAAYMPPEQAMGGETTAASDLYALGCVLYELVTGRPPFVGDDAVAVISQHVNTPPVAPTWHTPECPPGLETLITRLLAKDPAQRPSSATEVIQALASVDVQSATAATTAPSEAATSGGIYARTFVGREAELRQLQAAFDGALSGQGALVMVVGEPGIGKTAVTEQLLTYVAMRGGRALVGHCYEEGSLAAPYLPFVEAMRSYALVRERDQLQEELGTGAGEVARIVSEIRDRVAVELPPPGNPEEERFRLFQAVSAFLRNASAAQALCIVLEDLQDGDKGTMELLVHLARNLSGARLLIVGTYRDVEVDRRHPLSAALADLRRVESFTRIPLRGLSIDEVHRMMSNLAGQEVTFALAEGIYRQTEGNPLFIQEVMRYIRESGMARREDGQWVATVDSLLTQIPEGLRDVIGKRLSRLSDECNRILSVAAVMGRDFSRCRRRGRGAAAQRDRGSDRRLGAGGADGSAGRALSIHARLLPPDAVRRDDRAAQAAAAQRGREGAGAPLPEPPRGPRGGTGGALRALIDGRRPAQGRALRRAGRAARGRRLRAR
jgi:hypothetical protein